MFKLKKAKVALTFYGGVGEVGGNKVLVEDGGTKIFLDFGMSFSERRRFYSEPWLSPRDERGLLEFEILPKIDGIYRFDESAPTVDAVFLSHSHADHAMYVSFINRNIPVYCGETTAMILQALNEMRPRDFETDVSGLTFKAFRTGRKIKVDSFEVEPIHVDHSAPGAYGYIIHTSEGAVVYTGDFRTHGTKPEMTRDFVERASETEPIAMLPEGTNIVGADVSSEKEVRAKVNKVVAGTSNIVLADFSYVDIDRMKTFHEVAKENDRYLAISLRQAYMLNKLKRDEKLNVPDVSSDENILIYQRAKKKYYDWEREILTYGNVKEASEIKDMQDRMILVCSFFDLKELIEIKPKPGSNFILSTSEPFNEEQEIEFDKLMNWLDHFGLPMYHIHCSGHIMPNELKQSILDIKPKRLFPMHTDRPELFSKFISGACKVKIPKKGITYDLA
jgi:ribonuclease J